MVPVDKKERGTRNACAGTAAGAGVEICGFLNLNSTARTGVSIY